ncbi:MAG: RnfH family protein [Stenotrophobium sp.]
MANATGRIAVEVAYATPQEQVLLKLELPPGAAVRDAIEQSGILLRFPEIDPQRAKLGIFSRFTQLDEPLSAGDRVEIYRDLLADPKTVRRQRAALARRRR